MRAVSFSLSLALIGSVSLCSTSARAEVELPSAAPAARLNQQVGLTEITVEYDCPAAQGRKIWDGVVRFGRIWLAGSNAATRLKVSRDVKIGDDVIPAGSYWLLAIPGADAWTIIINKSTTPIKSTRDYRPELDIGLVKVAPKPGAKRERLIYTFSDVTDDRASLDIEWDGVRVSVPIEVNTAEQVQAAINGLDSLWRSYANAARYMLETKKDYDAGLRYIDQALALKDDWYCMWVKGHLLAAKGDFGTARDWAERARMVAAHDGSAGGLAPELERTIAEWSRRSGRPDKESRPLAKATEKISEKPGQDGERMREDLGEGAAAKLAGEDMSQKNASVHANTAPPPFNRSSEMSPPREVPPDSPPPALRRARLRHR